MAARYEGAGNEAAYWIWPGRGWRWSKETKGLLRGFISPSNGPGHINTDTIELR